VDFVQKSDGSDGYLDWQPTARRIDCLARMLRHEFLAACRKRLQVRLAPCSNRCVQRDVWKFASFLCWGADSEVCVSYMEASVDRPETERSGSFLHGLHGL
jgi:hypothetical protein